MKKNNFKSLMQAAVLICTPLVIASCDDVFGDVDNPIPSYMSIKEADVTLVLHKDSLDKATYTRTATAATGAEIVYSSSDEKVATVDAKTGKITAVGGGECEIIAEATGKDSHGNMTYQPQKSSFKVKVTDYRARIALKEGVEIPVYNSALTAAAEPIKLKEVLDVWPALGTELKDKSKLTVSLTIVEDTKGVISGMDNKGEITLNPNIAGAAKINVAITGVPTGFEQTSFGKSQKTADFTIEVKEGVAYVSGYDAEGNAIQKYMFKDYNGEKYTNLSEVLYDDKNNPIDNDVALAAGWYYVDKYINDFKHNIRIKGDVNFILGDGKALNMYGSKSIMDESANKAYKLNFFPETKAASGWVWSSKIQDFKEVNVLGVSVFAPVDKVANVTINKGSLGNLTGTGNVNITDGSAGNLEGFATVTLAKGTANVGNLFDIGSAIISEGTTVGDLNAVNTITIDKAKSVGGIYGASLKAPIASATISESTIGHVYSVTNLTLNKVTATDILEYIGTLNINKGTEIGTAKAPRNLNYIETVNMADGKVYSDYVRANALNVSGGDLVANFQIYGFDAKYKQAAGKVTMTGGTLTVGKGLTATNVKAVIADVEVTKGDFTAESNYHAVEGALIGTFYGSTDKNTWTKIENEDRPKYITTIEPKK
jgi:hypothetical protein